MVGHKITSDGLAFTVEMSRETSFPNLSNVGVEYSNSYPYRVVVKLVK